KRQATITLGIWKEKLMTRRLVCTLVALLTVGFGLAIQTFAQGSTAEQEARKAYERMFTAKEQADAAERRAADAEKKSPYGIDTERARQEANEAYSRYDKALNEARELRDKAIDGKATDRAPRGNSGVVDPDKPQSEFNKTPKRDPGVIDPDKPRQPSGF